MGAQHCQQSEQLTPNSLRLWALASTWQRGEHNRCAAAPGSTTVPPRLLVQHAAVFNLLRPIGVAEHLRSTPIAGRVLLPLLLLQPRSVEELEAPG